MQAGEVKERIESIEQRERELGERKKAREIEKQREKFYYREHDSQSTPSRRKTKELTS